MPPNPNIRYQPDEVPPHALSLGLAFQVSMLTFASVMLVPTMVLRASGQSESYVPWAVFASMLVCGLTTILQTRQIGRFGAGHVFIMGCSGLFIAVGVIALARGGPALLGTLVVVSSLLHLALSTRLSRLRRIGTPVVTGTVMVLLPVTIVPIVFRLSGDLPEGAPAIAAPACWAATLGTLVALTLRASSTWRQWSPLLGIGAGCVVASLFGLYDVERIREAAWFGLPSFAWQGLDLSFDASFWLLLPAFAFVTLIGSIKQIGDGIAIQRIAWRNPRTVDFRKVQGTVAGSGLSTLLAGLTGTMPNSPLPTSLAFAEITGVNARRVGVYIGIIFIALAFLPKVTALVLAIPSPVIAGHLMLLISLMFVQGIRLIVQDGIDFRSSVIVGIAFWIGMGFENKAIFAEQLGENMGQLLGNGMLTGGLVVIALTLVMEWTGSRHRRIQTALEVAAVPQIDDFLSDLAKRMGWNAESTERLRSVGEETLLSLIHPETEPEEAGAEASELAPRRLLVTARDARGSAELEFVASSGEENLEDQLLLLEDWTDEPNEREISLRLLRHYASSVRHQQYHETDIVTVRVDATG